MAAGSVPLAVHLGGVGVLALALVVPGVRAFLPSAPQAGTAADACTALGLAGAADAGRWG